MPVDVLSASMQPLALISRKESDLGRKDDALYNVLYYIDVAGHLGPGEQKRNSVL